MLRQYLWVGGVACPCPTQVHIQNRYLHIHESHLITTPLVIQGTNQGTTWANGGGECKCEIGSQICLSPLFWVNEWMELIKTQILHIGHLNDCSWTNSSFFLIYIKCFHAVEIFCFHVDCILLLGASTESSPLLMGKAPPPPVQGFVTSSEVMKMACQKPSHSSPLRTPWFPVWVYFDLQK